MSELPFLQPALERRTSKFAGSQKSHEVGQVLYVTLRNNAGGIIQENSLLSSPPASLGVT
jgi:hypothetical protein